MSNDVRIVDMPGTIGNSSNAEVWINPGETIALSFWPKREPSQPGDAPFAARITVQPHSGTAALNYAINHRLGNCQTNHHPECGCASGDEPQRTFDLNYSADAKETPAGFCRVNVDREWYLNMRNSGARASVVVALQGLA